MEYSEEIKEVFLLIQKGNEQENAYYNVRKACEYYKEARGCLGKIYGEDNRLCNIINLFDYIWEGYREEYRAAALKLADVGELLDNFSEQDIVDEFTAWISENREVLLSEVVAKTFEIFQHFDFKFSLEDILVQSILTRNDMNETINRTLIDAMGLPRRFHYLVQEMCKDAENIEPDTKYKMMELYDMMRKQQGRDFSNINREERIYLAESFYNLMQESIYKNTGIGAGMASFMDSSRRRVDFYMAKGMMGLGKTEYAESILSKLKNEYFDISDIDAQMKIEILECLLAHKKGNKAEACKLLEKIIEVENKLILQVFFLKEDQKKIEFLDEIDYLMKRIAEMAVQIKEAQEAYSLIVRTRTLSFDQANIHLSSDEHINLILKMQQLELRERKGENIEEEYYQLMDKFNRMSHGILSFDPTDICRKLTDTQAILEFTVMTDEKDCDFYYVFVVTASKITVVNLGMCNKLDEYIAGIRNYIEDYSSRRYSVYSIRRLSQYHELYTKISTLVGEVLPQSINSLFVAGAGEFLKIPFGLLPCFHWYDKFMEDEYRICYINSGKELLRDVDGFKNHGAVVIGNPDFGGKFPALTSAEKEVEAVASFLKVIPITGRDAVPGCLEKQAGIFHIATHSFFEEDEKNIDLMEKIGLVFAEGQLLSAKKIGQLDMSKTNLVVLSVCGVKEGKGTYSDLGPGIRRAFINAGVRHIILNLWKTDDIAAELLMKCFYSCYIDEKKDIEESLRTAKFYLRNSSVGIIRNGKYYDENMDTVFTLMKEEDIPYAHPYYWAGFITFGI